MCLRFVRLRRILGVWRSAGRATAATEPAGRRWWAALAPWRRTLGPTGRLRRTIEEGRLRSGGGGGGGGIAAAGVLCGPAAGARGGETRGVAETPTRAAIVVMRRIVDYCDYMLVFT